MIIIACVVQIFLVGKKNLFVDEGYVDVIISILCIPLYIILFPIYAIQEGNKTLMVAVYGAICLGSLLIILGDKMRKQ